VNRAQTAFRIRPIRPAECAALGEICVAAYHSLAFRMVHQDAYDEELRDVARRARSSCVLVAVTEQAGLLGGVTYVSGPQDPYAEELQEGEAGMRMLAVDPAHQGRGVGRALTLACLDRARAAGRCRLVLHTGAWMPVARHLYESLGFLRVPELDFSPVPGIDLLAYAFDLTARA
jgi:ribosomal protein S18 acetylase RimI-like enzyme